MLRAVFASLLGCALGAATAHADPILYATAATTGEVTSYCLGPGGGMNPDPVQRINTTGNAPSRLVVAQLSGGTFLYVAQNDRVEVFRVGERGALTRQGRIPARPLRDRDQAGLLGMNPHDLALATASNGTTFLYVPQRAFSRIAAFPLDPATGLSTVPTGLCSTGRTCSTIADCEAGESCKEGVCLAGVACPADGDCGPGAICQGGTCATACDPARPPATCGGVNGTCSPRSDQTGSSCILGPDPAEWEDVRAVNGLLYSSRAVTRGEVLIYQLASDGNFADGQVVVNENIPESLNPEQCANDACDQDRKSYPVDSADCTAGIEITDVNGNPITRPPTTENPNPSPFTVAGQIEPYARRRRLNGAGALILEGDLLYVSERFRRAISVFELCTASEPPDCTAPLGEQDSECTCPDENEDGVSDFPDLCPLNGFKVDAKVNKDGVCTARFRQRRFNGKKGGRTFNDIRYNAMAMSQGVSASTLLGAQFLDGRIDGYRLKDDGRLPRARTRGTSDNFRTSPFHLFVYRPSDISPEESAGVVYVGAGDIDRVQAYRLDRNGLPKDKSPFSQTLTLRDTFPNDVTVVDLPGPCGG